MERKNSSDGTVGKAIDVLDQVASIGRPIRFGELFEQSSYPKATLYRLLQTLTNQGMLSYDEYTQTYNLGVRLVRLAHAAWQQASLAPIARASIDKLSAEIGETVHLGQLDGGQVLYVDKRNANRPIQMFSDAGKIGPVYCTGIGKAMLAFLPEEQQARIIALQSYYPFTSHTLTTVDALKRELAEIRQQGISFDREEHEPHIICIAAPVLSPTGAVYGGISITTSTQRYSLEKLAQFKEQLIASAEEIGRNAESWRFPEQN